MQANIDNLILAVQGRAMRSSRARKNLRGSNTFDGVESGEVGRLVVGRFAFRGI